MTKKYELEALEEFAYNPFLNYKSERQFDEAFIESLSKTAKNIVKYLIYKHSFTEEKFLFNVNEFNRFMKSTNIPDPFDELSELCTKELLAKTKDAKVYWVNKDLFNTGVLQPKNMSCTEENSYN